MDFNLKPGFLLKPIKNPCHFKLMRVEGDFYNGKYQEELFEEDLPIGEYLLFLDMGKIQYDLDDQWSYEIQVLWNENVWYLHITERFFWITFKVYMP